MAVHRTSFATFLVFLAALAATAYSAERKPIPDRLVVLTFDDSVRSHFTVVRPILKQYGFKATFFITEGFDFKTNKKDYMTWDQIAQLHKDGFEIGNHTRDHVGIDAKSLDKIKDQLGAINQRCQKYGIPKPVSFAYPGNRYDVKGFAELRKQGIRFARRGGAPEYDYAGGQGFAYEPGLDHPLLIPSAGDARPAWKLENFIAAVKQARHGKIAVLQFHGVPDLAHPWVHTSQDLFRAYMNYLAVNKYKVIAMRDLAQYVDPELDPNNPMEVVEDRQRLVESQRMPDESRRPENEKELQFWLTNMVGDHSYSVYEASAATGLGVAEVRSRLKQWGIAPGKGHRSDGRLKVLPYPGGRHPRIGFLDGAMRPQRETKFSIFTPWDPAAYVVADIPEAIWFQPDGIRELLYLAHTHVPTYWSRRSIELPRLEWERLGDGQLKMERTLPNKVSFGAVVTATKDGVRMRLFLKNGSKEKLTGLRVQNCIMLKGSKEFEAQTVENKLLEKPFAACGNSDKTRWVITAWEHCQRPWGNKGCPCLHADPKFPDTAPGERQELRGWVSFYEGTEIQAELKRLRSVVGF